MRCPAHHQTMSEPEAEPQPPVSHNRTAVVLGGALAGALACGVLAAIADAGLVASFCASDAGEPMRERYARLCEQGDTRSLLAAAVWGAAALGALGGGISVLRRTVWPAAVALTLVGLLALAAALPFLSA